MVYRDATNPLGLPTISDAIVEDRACPRCSYNLKGLRTGDRCPECGTVIGANRRTQSATEIAQAPLEYLQAARAGALLMCVGLPVGTGAMLVSLALTWNSSSQLAGYFIAAGGFLAWGVGSFLIHAPLPGALEEAKVSDGGAGPKPAYWKWRTVNRVIGFAPMASMVAACAAVQLFTRAGGAIPAWTLFAIASALLGVIGVVAYLSVSYYQALLADWAADSETGHRFRTTPFVAVIGGAIFGLPFANVLSLVIGWGGVGTFSMLALAVTGAVTGYCFLGALRTNLAFANLFRWSIINRFTSMDINRRLNAKIAARIAENQSDASRKKANKSIHF